MNPSEVRAMTPEEKRVKLAELLGIEILPAHNNRTQPVGRTAGRDWFVLPDYCNDLNAVHEVEKGLRGEKLSEYQQALGRVVYREATDDDWCSGPGPLPSVCAWHATAEQRTEALILTLSNA